MTYVITNGCCSDSSCIPVCPVQCIRPRPGDPDFLTTEQLYIDPATCIDCGACMDECPVSAIHGEWDLPQELEEYLDVNAAYFETNPTEVSSPADPIRRVLPAGRQALKVAIVGTGPAGCYLADELSGISGVSLSIFDRLPIPFGLIRAGVAPDHPHTKDIAKRFGSVLGRANVECYLNVDIGTHLGLDELLDHHHAVIWAGGAPTDRWLGIPGENLDGCSSARELVAWYNAHPEHPDSKIDLTGPTVVVIGNGNVALDVARILARDPSRLETTDISDRALDQLARSGVREVIVTGRRGPQHAAFTTGELLDLSHLDGVALQSVPEEVEGLAEDGGRRSATLRRAAITTEDSDHGRRILLRFGLVPRSVNGEGRVQSVTFEREDGPTETIDTTMVITAIGYRGQPVPGLPFDETTGTLPHQSGRVMDPETGELVVGVYCSGWIKRGASGMIGTNRSDAAETIDAFLRDFAAGRLRDPAYDLEHLHKLVHVRQVDVVDSDGWRRIDQAERSAGRTRGRPRLKFTQLEDLLAAARTS
jgi:ferredoxin--NADP+ reductase